jgi:hypothetical protein
MPQASQPNSPTLQETRDWLIPTFNQNATETRSFVCGDGENRTQEQTSKITSYAPDGTTLDIQQVSSGMYGESNRTAHLILGTLFADVHVQKHSLVGGGSCHWEPNAWFQIVIIASKPITVMSGGVAKQENSITILFDDESMATRCAAAMQHLIALAGGISPKPPPF